MQRVGHIVQHVDHRAIFQFPATSASREAEVTAGRELIVAEITFEFSPQTIGECPTEGAYSCIAEFRLQRCVGSCACAIDEMLIL